VPEQEDDWHLMSFYDEFVASNGDLLTRQASAPCPHSLPRSPSATPPTSLTYVVQIFLDGTKVFLYAAFLLNKQCFPSSSPAPHPLFVPPHVL